MSRLQGKIAVVTGGSSGIGLATAQRFVKEGAFVFITGRRQTELDKAVELIGGNVAAVQGDVSNLDDLDRLFRVVKQQKGRLDVLVANSGVVEQFPLEDISPEHYDRVNGINARGVLFTVQKSLPLFDRGGSIILIGSIASYMGFPSHSTYSAAKAAVRSYARTWTAEFKDRGIRVNNISPGPIDTPMIDSQADSKEGADNLRNFFKSVIPLGRMGRADDIASAALYLASDESSFVAGVELSVDGGMGAV